MKKLFVGKWVSTLPYDSDDYMVEYDISLKNNKFCIRAIDLPDKEEMVITKVNFNKETLTFESVMPSTARKGINKFRLKNEMHIEAEFTFTVIEELKRI
jgi:hypothetical protein